MSGVTVSHLDLVQAEVDAHKYCAARKAFFKWDSGNFVKGSTFVLDGLCTVCSLCYVVTKNHRWQVAKTLGFPIQL